MMSVADELDKLRATLPGCTLVAFGDLDAGIVLCASSETKKPQEELDALCAIASHALDGGFTVPVAQTLGGSKLTQAVSVRSGEIRLFLRAHADDSDALFCTFADQTDVRDLVKSGRSSLERISRLP